MPVTDPGTAGAGGNTSCVTVAHDGRAPSLVLDAGTGVRSVSAALGGAPFAGAIVLSHLRVVARTAVPRIAACPPAGPLRIVGCRIVFPRWQEVLVPTISPPPAPASDDRADVATHAEGNLLVVAPRGSFDIYSMPVLRAELDRLAEGGDLVVDLSEVTLIDSAGLGALLRLRNRARHAGSGRFGLICPRKRLRRVFDITGLRSEFVIGHDLDAVRAMWGEPV